MLAKVMLSVLGTVAVAGVYVLHEGVVRVAADEHANGGKHIHLLLPAALVSLGIRFVPDGKLREATAQARPWLPAIEAASQELAGLPDCDLVRVRDAEQHVTISKRGRLLVIDVQAPGETVHVSLPLRTVNRVARQLESLGLPIAPPTPSFSRGYFAYCCTGVSLAGMK